MICLWEQRLSSAPQSSIDLTRCKEDIERLPFSQRFTLLGLQCGVLCLLSDGAILGSRAGKTRGLKEEQSLI